MDSNLHVFVGPQDNGRIIEFDGIVAGSQFASAIKCTTRVYDLKIRAAHVIGGKDACVDINDNASHVRVDIDKAEATGQFLVTAKGGCLYPEIVIGEIAAHGKVADVILGDWSDQSNERVKDPYLSCHSKNGPVTVIWLASDRPNLAVGSGPYRFKYWPRWTPIWLHKIIVYVFHTLRRWGLFRSKSNK